MLLLISVVVFSQSISIDNAVFDTGKVNFKSHSGTGYYSNYLTMEIPYAPVGKVLKDVENIIGKKLKNRGEAHITVLTPVEYNDVKDFISIEKINEIALDCNIQNSNFRILGVGKGSMKDSGKLMETYFIVVESYNLLNIRVKILKYIIENGGDISALDAYNFYPHITLGFTHRDLHIQDGVVKDENAVIIDVQVKK